MKFEVCPCELNNTGVLNYIDMELGEGKASIIPRNVILDVFYNDCIMSSEQGNTPDDKWIDTILRFVNRRQNVKYMVLQIKPFQAWSRVVNGSYEDLPVELEEHYTVTMTLKIDEYASDLSRIGSFTDLNEIIDTWI